MFKLILSLVLILLLAGYAVGQATQPQRLTGESIRADLEQFRTILKTEWLVAGLSETDYDTAIDELARRSADGMTRGDLLIEIQKILALGVDGHAQMSNLAGTLRAFEPQQGFPGFLIDICGDDYIAYCIEHLQQGAVNPRLSWRFKLLREGFPYVTAIDGVPTEKWIETMSRFFPKGPELSVRWRCVQWMDYLPFWRAQMGLPQSKNIKVQLMSRDRRQRIELDAPVAQRPLGGHLHIPKPDWKVIDDRFGYIWVRAPSAKVAQLIMEAMPQLRQTKGLIIDLRGHDGGADRETLHIMAAHLLPPDNPRRVVGSDVQWAGVEKKPTDSHFASDDDRLSPAGKKAITEYDARFKPQWTPPDHRAVQWRHVLLARPEAEPGIYPFNVPEFPKDHFYHYPQPVVVLIDHRVFSAGELFAAGIGALDNVTVVGSATTSAGGTSPSTFSLDRSGLEFMLGNNHSHVLASGEFIDGKGVQPDIIVVPDVDTYVGDRDRALETAIEVLKKRSR